MADHRRISEDEPAWASTLRRSFAELDRRLSAAEHDMPGGRQYHIYGEDMSPVTATESQQRRLQHSRTVYPRDLDSRQEDGRDHFNTSGQPREGRMDALYRKLEGQSRQMQALMSRIGRTPSIEDRNAIADARYRADGIYAALGRPTPEILPGEAPMMYRHRLAAGLRDLSPDLKRAHLDALPDGAFSVVESRIYADAATAIKAGTGMPAMTLRPHTFQDETGHRCTEYYGDNRATWAPFMSAGTRLKIKRPPVMEGKRWAL